VLFIAIRDAGVNQKLTPVSSATLHRWVNLMSGIFGPERFYLCPVVMHSAGIMLYCVERSGTVIKPSSTEAIPPGNYGLYFDRESGIHAPLLPLNPKQASAHPKVLSS
jgi:hypothetical protein